MMLVFKDAFRSASLNFDVKNCSIGNKLVFCSLTVASPRYDRRIIIYTYSTRLIDGDGDSFPMTGDQVNLSLERDQELSFKLAFAVNKDVVRPMTVKMVGSIDNERLDKGFQIR